MSRVLIHTIGGNSKTNDVGLGHVSRILKIAKALSKHEIFFLIEDYGGVKKFIESKGYSHVISIKPTKYSVKKIKNLIEIYSINLVIVDQYKIRKNYLKNISCFSKLVVISDLYQTDFPGDLVINGFIGFDNKIKKNKYGVKCLLGPKYQIIDSKKNKIQKKKKYDLLATFGGTDEKNISKLLIKSIKLSGIKKIKINLVIGPLNQNKKNIMKFKNLKNLSITYNPSSMIDEINKSKFGLCTGGMTSYEFAASKFPFAIICDTKHQLLTAKNWQKKSNICNLGLVDKKSVVKLSKFLKMIEENGNKFSKIQAKLIDRKGLSRIIKEITKIIN